MDVAPLRSFVTYFKESMMVFDEVLKLLQIHIHSVHLKNDFLENGKEGAAHVHHWLGG